MDTNYLVINSTQNKLIKYFNKLKDVTFSKKEKKFLIEGEHLIALASGFLDYIITKKEYNFSYKDIKTIYVSDEILEKLSSGKSKARIIGVCHYKNEEPATSNKLIYLNKVQDPGNVGTIFRTSLAFSYFDILADEETSFKYNIKTIQASQGAIFKENIVKTSFNEIVKFKENGYKIIATTLSEDSIFLDEFLKLNINRFILIFGNEGKGISKEILDIADYKIKIPIQNIDSLNVAISSGILLYELRKNN